MTICACRAAATLFSVTAMPSADASVARLAGLGCDATRFAFAPHPEARMPRRSAVPMFPAPIPAIFLTISALSPPIMTGSRRLTAFHRESKGEASDRVGAEDLRHGRDDVDRQVLAFARGVRFRDELGDLPALLAGEMHVR